jgi:eukaryotic-like serine/threonine-protein kinase
LYESIINLLAEQRPRGRLSFIPESPMAKAPCPPPEQFRELVLGRLGDEQVAVLEQHLRACARCAQTVEGLKVEDTLLSALRAGGPVASRAEQAVKAGLMAQVQALASASAGEAATLPPAAGPQSVEATRASACPGGAPGSGAASRGYDFLSPPQGPDELGRLGSYRVLKVLGAGGMGVVFQAEDIHLQRSVALKVMLPALTDKPGAKERFLREARTTAAIEHDHIVPIYQVGEERGVPFLAMPLLKGMSLEDWLRRREQEPKAAPPLKVAVILKLGREIARGLAAAHGRGLIHRDIKPANLWLDSSAGGRVKILDFGLARATSGEQNLTQSGMILGTPAYMAPEQARGEKTDARADLFSLGVVLYRLCAGHLPFRGTDMVSTLMALALHDPTPPRQLNPELPAALSELVMKLLVKDPAQRVQTAQEVVKTIQGLEKELAAQNQTEAIPAPAAAAKSEPSPRALKARETGAADHTQPIPQPRAKGGRSRRPLIVAAAAALGVLALMAVGAVFFWQTPHGIVRIEVNDPAIQVVFDKDGPTIKGADDKHDIMLRAGAHTLKVSRGDLQVETEKFELRKGETVTLTVALLKGKLQVMQGDRVLGEEALRTDPGTRATPPLAALPTVTNSIGMKLVRLPAGKFLMGSPAREAGHKPDEEQHEVTLTRPFFIGAHEVTVGQFKAFVKATRYKTDAEKTGEGASRRFADNSFKMDINCNWRNPGFGQTEDQPVVCVSWNDALAFCNWLSDKESKAYRLPTEAEWEYACRAGSQTRFSYGADGKELGDHAWFRPNSDQQTHPVGQKKANPWGLFDMHGNAWEWTGDWYAADYYKNSPKENPSGPPGGSFRVLRGGSWNDGTSACRSAQRKGVAPPMWRDVLIGFRVVCGVSETPTGPTPFDRLSRDAIPPDKLKRAGNGDPAKAPPQLVAIRGPGIYSSALSPDGKAIALAYQLGKPPGPVTNKVTFWDVETGAESLLAPITAQKMFFSHDSQMLAMSHNMFNSYDTGATVWNVIKRKEVQRLSRVPYREVHCAFTADDRSIIFGSPDRGPKDKGDRLSLVPVAGRKQDPAPQQVSFEQGDIRPHLLMLSADGTVLAAGWNNTLKVWDARTGKLLLATVTKAQRGIHDMAISADAKLLAYVEDYNPSVQVYDVPGRKWLGSFDGAMGTGNTVSVAFHPDGALAASCNNLGVVRLWNPRTFKQKRILNLNWPGGPSSDFWYVRFTPDGRHLLAQHPTGCVYLVRLAPPPVAAKAAPAGPGGS